MGGDRRWITAGKFPISQTGDIFRGVAKLGHVGGAHAHIFCRPVLAVQRLNGIAKSAQQSRGFLGFRITDDHRLATTKRQVGGGVFISHAFGQAQHIPQRLGRIAVGRMRKPLAAGPSWVECRAMNPVSPTVGSSTR